MIIIARFTNRKKAGNVTMQHKQMKSPRKIEAAGFKAFNVPEKHTFLDLTGATTNLGHVAYYE